MMENNMEQRFSDHLLDLWRKHTLGPCGNLLELRLNDAFTRRYLPVIKPTKVEFCNVTDAEAELPDQNFDVIASANTIHRLARPERFLRQAASRLQPGGLLVISTFGPQTFKELAGLVQLPFHFLSMEELKRILSPLLKIEELHDGLITKLFATPADVLNHLNLPGAEQLRNYPLRPDGRAPLTFNPIYLTARKA